MSDWHNEWPAKGLLQAYREAWAEIYRLRERIRELEDLVTPSEGMTISWTRSEESIQKILAAHREQQ